MLFITLLIISLVAMYLWLRNHYSYWEQRNVPHEKPVFFLGNMQDIGRLYHWKDINERLYRKFKNKTPIVGTYTFLTRTAFILDLDLIRDILIKDFHHFSDRGIYHNERDDPLTGNMLFLDGERWRVLREKMTPVFTTAKLKFMLPTIVEVSKKLKPCCDRIIQDLNGIAEVTDLCARYTTDVIGSCAFGVECNSLIDSKAEFRQMGRSIFEKPRHGTLVLGFMFTHPRLSRWLRMKSFSDEVTKFFINAVRETMEYRQKNNVRRNDVMDMLIEMKVKRDQLIAQGKRVDDDDVASGFTVEQMAAQLMMFFLAGFHKISSAMAFCLYELALNQDIQNKLRLEINEVLQRNNNQLTYECLNDMKYLDMVLSETLRKYSVISHLMRICVKDYKVPNTNIILEKGLPIIIPEYSIHRDAEYYPEPEKFIPERFLPEEISKRPPFSYIVFGDGPRACIGMRFAKIEAQIGIITMLKNYRFDRCNDTEIPISFSKHNILVMPKNGINLKIEKL